MSLRRTGGADLKQVRNSPRHELRILLKRKRLTVASVFLAYFGIYVVLTVFGRYEPAVWDIGGPKWYQWAPLGFVKERRWRMPMLYIFLPFWEVDRFFWHSRDLADSGLYPINRQVKMNDTEPAGGTSGSVPIRPK